MIHNFVSTFLAFSLLLVSSNATLLAIDTASLLKLLPDGTTFHPAIATPDQHLGWSIGTRHIRHHEVVSYAQKLCEQSDRMTWRAYGQTHGLRPLGIVVVSRPDRQSNLDSIANERQAWAYGDQGSTSSSERVVSPSSLPSVGWLGYSIHGDEASGVNASMLMLYILAAAQGPWIDAILEQHVLLVDPSLNPDGIDRFSQWVNDHRGLQAASDPQDIEHQQGWPRGRTNHYGFDLNRDWLAATQPESQGRLELYYQWLPNLLLDFHEMGTDQSLFFQPGVEGRDHPMSPPLVRDITRGFAKGYALSMDAAGQRFYTQERYDDFYPGKGSTYPDLHGSVGILVEQGSTRGLIHQYATGTRTFEETIHNPLRLSIASIAGLQEYHRPLLEFQRDFYSTQRQARLLKQPTGYAIKIPQDRRIANEFVTFMQRHRLRAARLTSTWTIDGQSLKADQWWVLPSDQLQGLFLQAIMDRTNRFDVDKFYDVSAWNMADAYGLEWMKLTSMLPSDLLTEKIEGSLITEPTSNVLDPTSVALAVPDNFVNSITLIQRLNAHGIGMRLASVDCQVTEMSGHLRLLGTGSIIIHRADQSDAWDEVVKKCEKEVNALELKAIAIKSSLTENGPDLGSDSFPIVEMPRIAMLVGDGTEVSGAGGLWFTLDRLLQLPVSRIETSQLTTARLTQYDCLFVPDGDQKRLSGSELTAVREWGREGGQIVLIGGAVASIASIVADEGKVSEPKALLTQVDGAILEIRPATNGYWSRAMGTPSIKVFQNDALWPIPSGAILKHSESPLTAGYLSEPNQKKIAGQTALGRIRIGSGMVTAMTFDPTFRGHYWGTIGLLKHILFPL